MLEIKKVTEIYGRHSSVLCFTQKLTQNKNKSYDKVGCIKEHNATLMQKEICISIFNIQDSHRECMIMNKRNHEPILQGTRDACNNFLRKTNNLLSKSYK